MDTTWSAPLFGSLVGFDHTVSRAISLSTRRRRGRLRFLSDAMYSAWGKGKMHSLLFSLERLTRHMGGRLPGVQARNSLVSPDHVRL